MAELDTIVVTNPLKEDFSIRFNGELYEVPGGQSKQFPEFLAFHIAKHLSDKMLSGAVTELKKREQENPFNPRVGQMLVYDNPTRRMRLYDILGSKEKVEACVNAYPFKGFIGEMSAYDEYVEKNVNKPEPKVEVNEVPSEKSEEAKTTTTKSKAT